MCVKIDNNVEKRVKKGKIKISHLQFNEEEIMMKNSLFEKAIIYWIIILFIGAGVVLNASVSGTGEEPIELNFSFDEPTIENITINATTYNRVIMSGLSNSNIPGEPCLPMKIVSILLPQGEVVEDINVTVEGKTFLNGSYFVEPGQEFYPISSNWTNITLPNPEIYNSSQLYPENTSQNISIQKKCGYRILLLKLFPVHYIPKTGELYYYTDMHLTISTTLVEPDLTNYRNLSGDETMVKKLVDNPGYTDTYTKSNNLSSNETYDYVIITNAAFADAFQNLTNWKETRGKYTEYTNLSTKTVLVENITTNSSFWNNGCWGDHANETVDNDFNDTQCQIRNFIKMAYNRTVGWSTKYVLLGGDTEGIPHREIFSNNEYYLPCDMYYGCLDDNWDNDGDGLFGEKRLYSVEDEADLFAEVYIGRAPVDNVSEANNFIMKTITYENATSNNESYLNNAMMLGTIGDGITEGGTSKDTITDIIPQYTTTRVYNRDGTYNKSHILGEIENGTHIINHVGHSGPGGIAGMESPIKYASISINDVESLSNDKYFLMYSIGCHSASYDEDDAIGEHFITASGGAFAYIGNSRYGFYRPGTIYGSGIRYDRSFFQCLMNQTLMEKTNLGVVLQYSKEELLRKEGYFSNTYFQLNLLGDPETQIKINISIPTAHFDTVKEYRICPPIYNGTVIINGTAKKGNTPNSTFNHYIVEYGIGLNPSTWYSTEITLSNNGTIEVNNGVLGYWNTSQIDDYYYTLRLTVYDENGAIGRDWFVVIISNAFTVHNLNKDVYYNSIQEAIDKADGDTIFIGNRNYYEVVAMNGFTAEIHPVNLIGDIHGDILIDPIPCGGWSIFCVSYCYYPVNISNIKIEKNHWTGIEIWHSKNTHIRDCIIKNQSRWGINIHDRSKYNTVSNCSICNISGIFSGIELSSNNNTITNCNFIGNKNYGITANDINNSIYHNNFFNNTKNAQDRGNNIWDNGYPSGGNYWDDYEGSDDYCGVNQDIPGNDGIGDTPYNISGGDNQDRYPLMIPWGTITPEITNVSNTPNIIGYGCNVTITADIISIGIDTVKVNITYPDNTYKEYIMNYITGFTYEYVFDAWQKGQYNYTIWADAGIINCSSEYNFSISAHCDILLQTIENIYYLNEYVNLNNSKINNTGSTDCQGYLGIGIEYNDNGNWILENETINETIARTILHGEFLSLDNIFNGKINTSNLFYETGQYRVYAIFRDPDGNILLNNDDTLMQAHYEFNCTLKISNVSHNPDVAGYGHNITIIADIVGDVNIASVNITYPDDSIESFTMNHVVGIKYEYVFNNTWQKGQYNCIIWVIDSANNGNYSSGHIFNISTHCDLSLQTLKNEYVSNEDINITGMPEGNWLNINSANLDSYCNGAYLEEALDGVNMWICGENHVHWFILDLGKAYTITKVRGRSNDSWFISAYGDPTDVNIYVSETNGSWGTPVATNISEWQDTDEWVEVEFTQIAYGRYVKVEIEDTETTNNYIEWGKVFSMTIFDIYGTETIYSIIKNVGDTDCRGYLWMGIEYNETGNWILEEETVNETTARTILHGEFLQLDDIFNGKVNTLNFNESGQYRVNATFRDPNGNTLINDDDTLMSANYNFNLTIDVTPPEIANISAEPNAAIYGSNVKINADITDNISGVNIVNVSITYPDSISTNYTMNNTIGDMYEYIFTDTWLVGQYNYTIWAIDHSSNINSSSGHNFNVLPINDDDQEHIHNIEDFQYEAIIISIWELYIGEDVIKSVTDVFDSASEIIDEEEQYRDGNEWKQPISISPPTPITSKTINNIIVLGMISFAGSSINKGKHLALGPIFKGRVHTKALTNGNGNYHIYAVFGDDEGNVLKCTDDTYLVAKCEFTVTGL